MSMTASELYGRTRAAAKRHPVLATVIFAIAAVYVAALVWSGGYGVGRDLARAENTPVAATD